MNNSELRKYIEQTELKKQLDKQVRDLDKQITPIKKELLELASGKDSLFIDNFLIVIKSTQVSEYLVPSYTKNSINVTEVNTVISVKVSA